MIAFVILDLSLKSIGRCQLARSAQLAAPQQNWTKNLQGPVTLMLRFFLSSVRLKIMYTVILKRDIPVVWCFS